MSKRPFRIGDDGEIEGIEWRIIEGDKGPEDQILQMRVRDWRHVRMGVGVLMAQFFYDNEERIYPSRFGYRGGWLYLDVCANAALKGWEWGVAEVRRQRELAALRRQRSA